MKETVREARTIITDKNGKILPVPEGTDPHVKNQKVGNSESEKIGRKAEAQSLEEVKDA